MLGIIMQLDISPMLTSQVTIIISHHIKKMLLKKKKKIQKYEILDQNSYVKKKTIPYR